MRGTPANHLVVKSIIFGLAFLALGCIELQIVESSERTEIEGSSQLAVSALSAIREGDYESASLLFHIPGRISESEREREYRDVASLLEIISRQFGSIQSVTNVESVPEVHEVGVIGGEVPLWSAMLREGIDAQRDYKVKFSVLGDGYLRFMFFRAGDQFRVRNIHDHRNAQFSLPFQRVRRRTWRSWKILHSPFCLKWRMRRIQTASTESA